MSIKYLIGDVFDRMAELDDGSVDLVLTSPPFLALRSYLLADHPQKNKEIGSEATPAEYINVLVKLSAEWRRLLAPHGSLVVELGDTFSGSGGAGGDYTEGGWREGQSEFAQARHKDRPQDDDGGYQADQRVQYEGHRAGIRNRNEKIQGGGPGWPLAKSLTLIPEAYRFALAYGINPHTGGQSPAGQWRVRNVIRWVRPNPPVGALGDKFRPATSELVVACVSKDRWFDLDAVRSQDGPGGNVTRRSSLNRGEPGYHTEDDRTLVTLDNPAGAPPLDWWKLPPGGYKGAHYAVWPPELCVVPVKSMCPAEVCRECGEPRRRVTEQPDMNAPADLLSDEEWQDIKQKAHALRVARDAKRLGLEATGSRHTMMRAPVIDDWSDCGHDNYRPGLVLDPFAGTGTTLLVAHGHGRDAIGIDIDERSAELARERIGGLFLEVVLHLQPEERG